MLGIAAPAVERLGWNLRALALAEASPQPRAQGWRGSLYNNIGWTYHDLGQYDDALTMFKKALAWQMNARRGWEAVHAREVLIASWTVARALRSLGQVDAALACQQSVLVRYQESNAEPGGYLYEELGECLLALGRAEEAQPYFVRAYAMLAQIPG